MGKPLTTPGEWINGGNRYPPVGTSKGDSTIMSFDAQAYARQLVEKGLDPDTAAEVARKSAEARRKEAGQAPSPATITGCTTGGGQPPKKAAKPSRSLHAKAASGEGVTEPQPRSEGVMRNKPKGDDQHDFFTPCLYDVSGKDNRALMDVAVFRLSKRDKRAGEIVRYDMPDGYVEVSAGPYGMASIWDYDIILMMVSQLTEAMNRYRDGKGERPGRIFQPHVADILKFCRKSNGARQYKEIEGALDRLKGTQIKFSRKGRGRKERKTSSVGLIDSYDIISRTDSGSISSVSIGIPTWIYEEVTASKRPDVLAVHPDYFLIEPGVARFIYRLARRAAGKGEASWGFSTLYERSGSKGEFKKFCWTIRKIIKANDLPEYSLQEQTGREGPILVMTNREAVAAEAASEEEES